jgi:hypothetical protein
MADGVVQPTGRFDTFPGALTLSNALGKKGGKTRRRNRIGPLATGLLTRVGYSTSKPPRVRRRALTRAVKAYGPLSTLRKLNAVRTLTKRKSPPTSRIYDEDVRYIQKKYY